MLNLEIPEKGEWASKSETSFIFFSFSKKNCVGGAVGNKTLYGDALIRKKKICLGRKILARLG